MLDSTGKLAVHNVAGGAGVALALQHNYIGGGDIRDAVPAGDTARPSCAKTMSITTCW
ncbi:Uncharacterised protein [Klebsiella pneumoniae]|uniref:Uncharacterized protein n=1 Tax=Klebsiella pneumoniae TaxID=573 RepID=A0A2X3C711_KLEPN|nr:Uncharacterised protein [Klebsiella pneumoniae]